jgi:MFS family permease
MNGLAVRILPYLLAFFSSMCIMVLELVASRLVARHVGASLSVWTSVIGIMLGGICLGNVLGGRLADRVDPGKAIGPLYALGAFLTIGCLWMNAVVGLTPGLESLSWNLRTVVVVTLDFLVPATVLGMIGPVVAKLAVIHAQRTGSAIGDVYFMGAIGSIVGTFLAGFVLMYVAPTSTIITLVAAALALLAAAMLGSLQGAVAGVLAAALLGLGSIAPLTRALHLPTILLGSVSINPLALAGHAVTIALAVMGILRLSSLARERVNAVEEDDAQKPRTEPVVLNADWTPSRPKLSDLAALSFVASLAFMALEMAAGRMVTRHLGSSVYGWTSVIGVLLGGLSLGNYLGGKIADRVHSEQQASWLFLVASIFTLSILLLETPPNFEFIRDWLGERNSVLSQAITMTKIKLPRGMSIPLVWWQRVLMMTTLVFFLPSITMGTVSPVVAKLAVERVRNAALTGRAIGQVYAWGMVGSILGTFLAGFVLIDVLGTKGLVLILGTALALAATTLGSVWHAAWAGVPLGLCVLAFAPGGWRVGRIEFEKLGVNFGLREEKGKPYTIEDAIAWVDETDYYYIKVTSEPDAEGGWDLRLLSSENTTSATPTPGRSLVVVSEADHVLRFRIFDGTGKLVVDKDENSLTSQKRKIQDLRRQLLKLWPPHEPSDSEKAHVVEAVTAIVGRAIDGQKRTLVLDNLIHGYFILGHPERLDYDYEHIYALVSKRVAEAKAKQDAGRPESKLSALFLGGGAYTFQRYVQHTYPGTAVDVAEIDPAVTNANHVALGLPPDTPIKTTWGDARQFVEKHQTDKQYDLIYGDAFNDFSVPWHLTTREFNEKLARMMSPIGVYMINIIDVYESDATAAEKARVEIADNKVTAKAAQQRIRDRHMARAKNYGGFLGAWVKTAKQTFPHVAIFGTDDNPGGGLRETFVVVASKQPIKIDDLGSRNDDPQFFQDDRLFEPRPFAPEHVKAIDVRSRDIVLTDDYAPVENLLAPVAATRGDD